MARLLLNFILLTALAVTSALPSFANPPRDPYGPYVVWNAPHLREACVPLRQSDACMAQNQPFYTVNKADGSGILKLGITYERDRKPSKVNRERKTLGFGHQKKLNDLAKKTIRGGVFRGLYNVDTGEMVEPTAYGSWLVPISDSVGLTRFGDVMHLVALNGKVHAPIAGPFTRGSTFYIRANNNTPVHMFVLEGNSEDWSQTEIHQYGPDGQVKKIYTNLLMDKRGHVFMQDPADGSFIARARHPETGDEMSLRWDAQGNEIGYGYPVLSRFIATDIQNNNGYMNLMTRVGRLPMQTDLVDDTLYFPVNIEGRKIDAPDNFIGMARLNHHSFQNRSSYHRFQNWLLVYALEDGRFGYKVAHQANPNRKAYPDLNSHTAHNVLAAEAEFMMLAGFGMQTENNRNPMSSIPIINIYIAQVFDRYLSDGLTPAPGARPAGWYRFGLPREGKNIRLKSDMWEPSYPSSGRAFDGIIKQMIAEGKRDVATAQRFERERQELARRAEAERQARIAELIAEREQRERMRRAYEASPQFRRDQKRAAAEAEWDAFVRDLRNPVTINRVDGPSKRIETRCYDNGDGTATCFEEWKAR
ncbi:MAG: hypothetical protein AAF296_08470 [Pseudomonadota bacterium]